MQCTMLHDTFAYILSVLALPHLYSTPGSAPCCYVGVHVAVDVPSDDEGVADALQQLTLFCAHVGCAVVQPADLQGSTPCVQGRLRYQG